MQKHIINFFIYTLFLIGGFDFHIFDLLHFFILNIYYLGKNNLPILNTSIINSSVKFHSTTILIAYLLSCAQPLRYVASAANKLV